MRISKQAPVGHAGKESPTAYAGGEAPDGVEIEQNGVAAGASNALSKALLEGTAGGSEAARARSATGRLWTPCEVAVPLAAPSWSRGNSVPSRKPTRAL